MSQRKKKRGSSALTRAKNAVRGAKHPLLAFDRARLGLDLGTLVQFASWFRSTEPNILFTPKAINIGDLCRGTILYDGTLADARYWAVAELSSHVDTVRSYIDLRNTFETNVAAGCYEEALLVLQSLEQDVGFSIWSIEQKIFLLERTSGLEAQKEYTEEVLQQYPERSLVSFLAHWISQRNESDEYASTLVRRLMYEVQHWDHDDNLKCFLDYVLSENFDNSDASLKGILQRAATSSVVDLYEAFIHTSQAELARTGMIASRSLKQAVRLLLNELPDWRLQNVSEALGGHEGGAYTQRILGFSSKPSADETGAKGAHSDWALDDVAYFTMSGNRHREWLSKNINTAPPHIQSFIAAVVSEDDVPTEARKVLGFVTNSNKLAFSKVLRTHLDQHFVPNVWAGSDAGLAFLNLRNLTPYCLRYAPNRQIKGVLFQQFAQTIGVNDELLVEGVRAGVSMEFVEGIVTSSATIDTQTRLLMSVDNALWNEDYPDAIRNARELLNHAPEELIQWGARSMAQALLASGATNELVTFLAEHRIIHQQSGRGLPIDECVTALKCAPGHDRIAVADNKALSIEVKTRQFLERPTEITGWPVNMHTKGDADFFLAVELNLQTLSPTF